MGAWALYNESPIRGRSARYEALSFQPLDARLRAFGMGRRLPIGERFSHPLEEVGGRAASLCDPPLNGGAETRALPSASRKRRTARRMPASPTPEKWRGRVDGEKVRQEPGSLDRLPLARRERCEHSPHGLDARDVVAGVVVSAAQVG